MANDSDKQEEHKPLHRSDLASQGAIAALGLAAARQIAMHGEVYLYEDKDGFIQIAPAHEVPLDALPEPMAIQALVDRGYGDEELESYLRGRDARITLHG